MNENKNGGPAFPSGNEVRVGPCVTQGHAGMTLRAYFAAHAPMVPADFERKKVVCVVARDAAGSKFVKERLELNCEVEIRWRWHYADMMLEAMEA